MIHGQVHFDRHSGEAAVPEGECGTCYTLINKTHTDESHTRKYTLWAELKIIQR
jgi:hypothetical protein